MNDPFSCVIHHNAFPSSVKNIVCIKINKKEYKGEIWRLFEINKIETEEAVARKLFSTWLVTLFKKDAITGHLLWVLQVFPEQVFYTFDRLLLTLEPQGKHFTAGFVPFFQ